MTEKKKKKSTRAARRHCIRAEVVPIEMKGIVHDEENGRHQPCLVWDLSETGLGLWLPERVEVGCRLRIDIGSPARATLWGEIAWCDETLTWQGYRCGVRLVAEKTGITQLLDCLPKRTIA